jgi:hypothetical protein
VIDPHDSPDTAAEEGSAEGQRQAQLKQLVDEASQAFIPVSHEMPPLDPSYLAERAAAYANTLRPSDGGPAGTSLPLTSSAPVPPPSAHAADAALSRLLDAEPADATEAALVSETAVAVAAALAGVGVRGTHEVLVTVG